MATELSRGTLFKPTLVNDLLSKVKGKSSLAVLSAQEPIPFNGKEQFIFSMDNEVDVVAENGKKTHGGISIEPVTVVPIKIEYGARISDEFIYASEEEQIDILKSFNDGFAKKAASGMDLMAFHGVNPRTGNASAVIGTNHFDSKVTQTVTVSTDPDGNVSDAIALVDGSDGDVSGMAMSKLFSSELAKLKVNGVDKYPELKWGGEPGSINGLPISINKTVSGAESLDRVILGDFENMFKWGIAKEVPFEIIKFGDPDNSEKDLKGYNQIYLRAEMYIGWGILDGNSFARIVAEKAAGTTTPTEDDPTTQ